ncbi:MAG: hypothetical protein WCR79_01685 [Fusobacterium sp.]
MANEVYKLNNIWNYGEIGERLAGIRNSEIYNQGAKSITNFLVTDIGSLKVAKTYLPTTLPITGKVINVRETAKGYSIILTSENIYRLNNATNSIEQTISHTMGDTAKLEIIDSNEFAIYNGISKVKSFLIKDTIETSSTFDNVELPIKKQIDIKANFITIIQDPITTSKLLSAQQASYINLKIKVVNGEMFFYNSETKIDRVYTTFLASPSIEYFKEPKKGENYLILNSFEKVEGDSSYIVGNSKVTLGNLIKDTNYNGSYFTSLSGNSEGVFTFGELIENIIFPERMIFFQDRTFICKDNVFYASKLREPNNFKNITQNTDDPFIFQLNPIDNKMGNVVGITSNIGLFILTTVGIYIIGNSGGQLSPITIGSNITIISNVSCSDKFSVKNNSVYFLNSKGTLQVLFLDKNSVQLNFNVATVDRFSFKNLFSTVNKLSIDNKDYIVCRGKDNKHMYIIDLADVNGVFRKVKLELDTTNTNSFLPIEDKILIDNKLYIPTENNYHKATLEINAYNLTEGAMYLTDSSSRINDIVVKLYNEDREAVEGVMIDSKPISSIGDESPDLYNVYRQRTSIKIKQGFKIEVFTNKNNKIVELQGVQSLVKAVIDR